MLKQLDQKLFEFPVIVMTAYGTSRTAIKAMQLGAYDYLTKPFDLDELVTLTQKALAHHQAPVYQVGESTLKAAQHSEELLGKSAAMQTVFKLIGRVAPVELPPLRDRPEDLEQLTQHFLSCPLSGTEAPGNNADGNRKAKTLSLCG